MVLKSGKCGIDFIKNLDVTNFKAKVAGELKDFNIEDYMDKKEARRMDEYCQYAMVAAEEAMKNSNLDIESLDKERFGVIIGSGIGGLETITVEYKKLMEKRT